MEYRTVSTKMPVDELTMFRTHCEKKGVSPANLLRELILKETKIHLPTNVAGKNIVHYNKDQDSFTWLVKIDSGATATIMKNISPLYLEDLKKALVTVLEERASYIQSKKKDSVPIPAYLLKGESK